MMVETALELSQDLVMSSSTGLPQWKRELIQRRAYRVFAPTRASPAAPSAATTGAPAAPPPAPPLPPEEDEELRYGPGIVKRLKSRYLSLALRDAPRRRPSVLRRAASLEHLLEQPPPSPPVAPHSPPRQPAAHRAAAAASRRDSIKRARSVDALSRLERLDSHYEERPPAPTPRAPRPPRRPTPLLSDAERPPPDVVRSALRKFESAPTRRPAPAARVSGVLRGLARTPPRSAVAAATQTTPSLRGRPPAPPRVTSPRCSTPEPRTRTPSPASSELSAIRVITRDEIDEASLTKQVSRAALEGIARAGASVRYSFECAPPGSHLPALAAANPVVLGRARLSPSPRQVGVIRPMPSPTLAERSPPPPPITPDRSTFYLSDEVPKPALDDAIPSDSDQIILTDESESQETSFSPTPQIIIIEKCEEKISLVVEIAKQMSMKMPSENTFDTNGNGPDLLRECRAEESRADPETDSEPEVLVNGNSDMDCELNVVNSLNLTETLVYPQLERSPKIEEAKMEKIWKNGVSAKGKSMSEVSNGEAVSGGARRPAARRAPPVGNSVVFNFSNRKEVPDYVENDGLILRASRKDKLKPGDPGVVVLRGAGEHRGWERDEDEDEEAESGPAGAGAGTGRAPSPCDVRFLNDNVLINGRSSLAAARVANRDRIAKLKLQFDDSLTRTFEYPSEASLCGDAPSPAAPAAPAAGSLAPAPPAAGSLAANTHLASAALSSYRPCKIRLAPAAFQLGVTPSPPSPPSPAAGDRPRSAAEGEMGCAATAGEEPAPDGWGGGGEYLKPCADAEGRAWSDTRQPDLLF